MGNHTINKGKGQRRALRNANQKEEGYLFIYLFYYVYKNIYIKI